MNKIEVFTNQESGKVVLGVKILDKDASLQDLLDAWQPLCDDTIIHKEYAPGYHDACKGCQHNCCDTAYVIPDIIAFKRIAGQLGLDHKAFIQNYFQLEKLSAGLLRLVPNPCIFLKNKICSIYELRTLICRFYICTPLQGETEELIYKLSWAGAAATQLYAAQQGLLKKDQAAGLSSFDLLFYNLLNEYRDSQMVQAFLRAEDYGDIPLALFYDEK